jgi:arginase family enzyme
MSRPDPETSGFTMYGPEFTFLGVPRADLDDPASLAGADVVVVGAPFDGGTSHRPGTRFGPSAIRGTDYLGRRSPLAWTPSAISAWSTSATC